jgi:hypothetical protein
LPRFIILFCFVRAKMEKDLIIGAALAVGVYLLLCVARLCRARPRAYSLAFWRAAITLLTSP